MKSMTGFGLGEYTDDACEISVEIKTVNHRYKDFLIKMPRKISSLEENTRRYVGATVSRGRAEVNIKFSSERADSTLKYDRELAAGYARVLEEMHRDFPQLENDVRLSTLAKLPDVITTDDASLDMEDIWKKLQSALDIALNMLDKSRAEEGEKLRFDFEARIDLLADLVKQISNLSVDIPKSYYETLMKNIQSYIGGVIDENRMATEMAIYADRCSINEELVRLGSHLINFGKIISLQEPVGRKLDFLLQEINREANTIASKSNSYEISTLVVEIKSELEKMREQVQNIE